MVSLKSSAGFASEPLEIKDALRCIFGFYVYTKNAGKSLRKINFLCIIEKMPI